METRTKNTPSLRLMRVMNQKILAQDGDLDRRDLILA